MKWSYSQNICFCLFAFGRSIDDDNWEHLEQKFCCASFFSTLDLWAFIFVTLKTHHADNCSILTLEICVGWWSLIWYYLYFDFGGIAYSDFEFRILAWSITIRWRVKNYCDSQPTLLHHKILWYNTYQRKWHASFFFHFGNLFDVVDTSMFLLHSIIGLISWNTKK